MRRIPLWLGLLVFSLVGSPASANESPSTATALDVQAAMFEGWTGDGVMMHFLAPILAYNLSTIHEPALTSSPLVTVNVIDNVIRNDFGWHRWSSHGNDNFTVEFYSTAAARDAALSLLLQSGYTTSQIQAANVGTVAYGIGLKADFFRRGSWWGSFVHLAACKGTSLNTGMLGVGSFVGYNYNVSFGQSRHDDSLFYHQLGGFTNPQRRTVGEGVIGTTLTPLGNSNFELAPMVSATDLVYNERIAADVTRYVHFSGPMFTGAPATSVVKASGAMKIQTAAWQGNDQIMFTVRPRYRGAGKVWVESDTTSGIFGSAKSYPGLIPLVGNVNGQSSGGPSGPPGTSGAAGFGPYENVMFSDAGGDNPAASVTAFSAVHDPAGIVVSWTVENEYLTDSYRLERARDWSGPYVTVSTVPAAGQLRYQVVDPAGHLTDVYRLIEVETTGQELRQAEEQATMPFEIPADMAVTPEEARRVTASLLEQHPTPLTTQTTSSAYEWVTIIPNETYRSAVQPLENFHLSRGRLTAVMTLAQVGGVAGIRPFVQSAAAQGLRYLTICADANNWRDHDDPAAYYGGYTHPGYPSQSAYDVIPMSASIPDPVGNKATGLPFFTSRYTTDALYGDVDGDSLADIAVSRIPCRTPAELSLMIAKVLAGHNRSMTLGRVGFWGEFRNLSGLDGPQAQQWCDSLVAHLPPGTDVRKLYHTEGNQLPYTTRQAQAISALHEGRDVLLTFGTQSNRAKWAVWLDRTQGFNWSMVGTSALPYLVAASCDIIDFDRSEDPAYGRPLFEEGLLYSNKAPYAGWGSTRGTWQHDNFELVILFYDFAYDHGAGSAAEAMMLAAREYGRRGPEFKHQALELVHFGDAAALMPGMVVRTTGVDDDLAPGRLILSRPMPNPFRGSVRLSFSLPSEGHVDLAIFDPQGRRVAQLVDGWQTPGTHHRTWTASGAGLYFVRLVVGGESYTQKMVHIR